MLIALQANDSWPALLAEITDETRAVWQFLIDREIEAPERYSAIQSYRAAMAILRQQRLFVEVGKGLCLYLQALNSLDNSMFKEQSNSHCQPATKLSTATQPLVTPLCIQMTALSFAIEHCLLMAVVMCVLHNRTCGRVA